MQAKRYRVATRDIVLCSLEFTLLMFDQTLLKVRTLVKLIVMMHMSRSVKLNQKNLATTSTIQAPAGYMGRAERAIYHLRRITNKMSVVDVFFERFTKNAYDSSSLYLSKFAICVLYSISPTVKSWRSNKVLLRVLPRASLPELIFDPAIIRHLVLCGCNVFTESRI